MQHLEVSGAVRPIYGSLGVKRIKNLRYATTARHSRAPQFYSVLLSSYFKLVTLYPSPLLPKLYTTSTGIYQSWILSIYTPRTLQLYWTRRLLPPHAYGVFSTVFPSRLYRIIYFIALSPSLLFYIFTFLLSVFISLLYDLSVNVMGSRTYV